MSAKNELHQQALAYAESGKLDEAERCLRQAIEKEPKNVVLPLHLANILKEKKSFDQAEALLREVIQAHPDLAAAYNNLGTVLYAQQKWQEACGVFQTAIDLQPDYADAYFNLGLSWIKQNQYEDALNVFAALIDLVPNHVGARFQLGCLWMLKEKYPSAKEQFTWILDQYPHHAETIINRAACNMKLGYLDEAKNDYLNALSLLPNDTQVLFNLGVIDMQQGDMDDAIGYYTKAIAINPDYYEGHNNLSVAYLKKKDYEAAKRHFKEVLRILPHNEAVRHTMEILDGNENVTGSPPEYIRVLFDSYADHYDAHLTQSLHYQVPEKLLALFELSALSNNKQLDVLDLGCGTGLTGVCFKPFSKRLVGVDLSEKMLTIAKEKQIYDELVPADILAFLSENKENYDLIVAGDVLNYFGELDALFQAVTNTLKPSGCFLFNSEVGSGKSYKMTESGRFAHDGTYLDQLAKKYHFKVEQHQEAPIRTQNDETVMGHLYLLKKEGFVNC